LAQVDCILFDKTGTLTDGKLTLEKICLVADFNELDILKLAWVLEKGVDHPVAKAIVDYAQKQPNVAEGQMLAGQQQVTQGCGVCAVIDTRQYYLGNTAFIAEKTAIKIPPQPLNSQGAICILLADEQQAIGWIVLRDQLRPDAVKAVSDLQRLAKETHLVSGDSAQASALVANKLAIEHFNGQMKPHDKIAYLQRLTVAGKKVLMVGDGINDAAALKQAHVSIAMHSASEFVQAKADGVMLSSQLAVIVDAIRLASDTRKITRQNITWALIYNVTAMPLAVMGYIPPWFAALGMSVSSLIVLMNSYRLNVCRLNDVTDGK
jgi:Cu2+-exporting ATPase